MNVLDCANRMMRDKPLYDMFTAVPRRYDMVNHVITWGLDKRWRQEAARECVPALPGKVLDLCCGTGDLALNVAHQANNNVTAIGLDYSQPMLDIAAKKAERLDENVAFIHGDVASLPFPDGYFDCVGISFAFRNLTHKNPLARSCIDEVLRVLSPGGRFVIVESSQPEAKLTKKLYHLYLRWFVSRVGSLLSGNRGAYYYLAESAARYYAPTELREMLITAGFREVFFRPLFLGAVAIHVAIK
jgi:demethylmenaquinone methyltransferase/2-methoxy-6-polyprenyl-1,4-benzoquinol methylase